eukprot:3855358-Lingulodinium_polyedra.AAC.1
MNLVPTNVCLAEKDYVVDSTWTIKHNWDEKSATLCSGNMEDSKNLYIMFSKTTAFAPLRMDKVRSSTSQGEFQTPTKKTKSSDDTPVGSPAGG